MAMNEGIRRLGRVANCLYFLGLAGLVVWLAEVFTVGRWGLYELVVLAGIPPVMGGAVKIFSWLLEGFFRDTGRV